jgi:hypothetical protein
MSNVNSRAWGMVARHGGLLVNAVRAIVAAVLCESGVAGRREWSCTVHCSMLREIRHEGWRSVAGWWLAGCIHCIVEPDQASGGGPDRKYRETPRAFLGVGGSTGVEGVEGGGGGVRGG